MMKHRNILAACCITVVSLFVACNNATDTDTVTQKTDSAVHNDSVTKDATNVINPDTPKMEPQTGKFYSNEAFKDVAVEKVADDKYKITGKARVFEAAFSWVVEDGHNELKEGHEMTSEGAPAFGNFTFTVEVNKQNPNSTLMMILYEASAKDGSRQHQLAIPLG